MKLKISNERRVTTNLGPIGLQDYRKEGPGGVYGRSLSDETSLWMVKRLPLTVWGNTKSSSGEDLCRSRCQRTKEVTQTSRLPKHLGVRLSYLCHTKRKPLSVQRPPVFRKNRSRGAHTHYPGAPPRPGPLVPIPKTYVWDRSHTSSVEGEGPGDSSGTGLKEER